MLVISSSLINIFEEPSNFSAISFKERIHILDIIMIYGLVWSIAFYLTDE